MERKRRASSTTWTGTVTGQTKCSSKRTESRTAGSSASGEEAGNGSRPSGKAARKAGAVRWQAPGRPRILDARGRPAIRASERGAGGVPGLLAILALAAILAGCEPETEEAGTPGSSSEPAVRVTDDADRRIRLVRPPSRIVSLVPSATEILLDLGAGARLIGRTDFDTLPPLDTLPSVGGGLHPSIERLVALEPDLVIRFAAASDRRTPDRLDALGIRHLAVRPDGVDDVRRIVTMLGRVVGARARADSLVARIDSTLADVAARVQHLPRKRVAFVLEGSPPWVAGPGTFIDQLLEVAGGENVFSDLGDLYGPVSPEAFVSRSIDVVVSVEGARLDLPERDFPVRRVSSDIQTPGPDLGESARELARALHPEAFP